MTLNVQRTATSSSQAQDCGHHKMIYGVAYNPLQPECAQIYLTNPLSHSTLEALKTQLASPSTLTIKRADILSRWTPLTDLMPLAIHPNQHWLAFNVLGIICLSNVFIIFISNWLIICCHFRASGESSTGRTRRCPIH